MLAHELGAVRLQAIPNDQQLLLAITLVGLEQSGDRHDIRRIKSAGTRCGGRN